MRIQLVSDLHLEFLAQHAPREKLFELSPAADVLVLAGDIAAGAAGVHQFADSPVPVLYVLGNHEAYGSDIDQTLKACRDAAAGTALRVLEQDSLEFRGVRFLGCTLWTDYRFNSGLSPAKNMAAAERALADHRAIRQSGRPFTAGDALQRHVQARAWLAGQLRTPYSGPTVVISHHAPHPRSVHPRFMSRDALALNGAFVSDLGDLLGGANLWLHGHVHDCFDYREAGCRVVANPRGYMINLRAAPAPDDFEFENPAFRRDLLLEV